MDSARMQPQAMTRITCVAHQVLERAVMDRLEAMGVHDVMAENARCVRERVRARALGLSGRRTDLHDSPVDIYQTTVPREAAPRVAEALIDAAELRTPGRGMLYSQDVKAYGFDEGVDKKVCCDAPSGMVQDMTLFTCILSMAGSGESLARIVLTFGVGVPVVSRGVGTGLRDRLGLLRITIPPEKEIVRFMTAAHDADGIRRLLVEEGRLDRPGGGFLYQTPIREGISDALMRIGAQRHAASMAQMIAALDELKGGTRWRTRYAGLKDQHEEVDQKTQRNYREIAFACSEGNAEVLVREAMEAGAGSATTSTADCLRAASSETGSALRETGILCVPEQASDAVVEALTGAATRANDEACRIQVLEAPAVFTYQRSSS